MDNLKVYHTEHVRVAIEPVGAKVKFYLSTLLTYHPQSLEESKLKQFLRSCEVRTCESLNQAMAEVVNYISLDDTFSWFN